MRTHAPTHRGFTRGDIEPFPTVRVLPQGQHAKRHTPMPCGSDWGRRPYPRWGAVGGVGGCGTWLGAVGLAVVGVIPRAWGLRGMCLGGAHLSLGRPRAWASTSRSHPASPVYRGEPAWVSALGTDGRSPKNPWCLRGRRPACAVTAYLRVGTAGRTVSVRAVMRRSRWSRRRRTSTPCMPPGGGPETGITGENGGYTHPV
jgi:hypothetical protein